ncbi:MAG TPA: hypothetical protein VEU94_16540 [Terriglobales bacterium]|nr:hypothetical protein [Terriglobales bacterium]
MSTPCHLIAQFSTAHLRRDVEIKLVILDVRGLANRWTIAIAGVLLQVALGAVVKWSPNLEV